MGGCSVFFACVDGLCQLEFGYCCEIGESVLFGEYCWGAEMC